MKAASPVPGVRVPAGWARTIVADQRLHLWRAARMTVMMQGCSWLGGWLPGRPPDGVAVTNGGEYW
ncbi:MAG: hypothetical protein IPK19_42100 [Chloroflexi bacterium]|nr:hypothetical protein [Chloroflexota bacterium]